jgi:hypothetical protein
MPQQERKSKDGFILERMTDVIGSFVTSVEAWSEVFPFSRAVQRLQVYLQKRNRFDSHNHAYYVRVACIKACAKFKRDAAVYAVPKVTRAQVRNAFCTRIRSERRFFLRKINGFLVEISIP